MKTQQLPLVFPAGETWDESWFLPAPSNEAARTWLARTELWPDGRFALWGGPAHGKTHLLQIWAARLGATCLSGPGLSGFPDVVGPTAVDDADDADEAALLHLLNTARDQRCPVLLAAREAPARWKVALPDLASRLRAITTAEVEAPDDDLLRALLHRWMEARRLVAAEPLHDRLLLRLPRRPEVLRDAVARLDRDALISRRRTVTPGMLRAALAAAELEDPESMAVGASPKAEGLV